MYLIFSNFPLIKLAILRVVSLPLDSSLIDASWKLIKQAVSTARNTFSGSTVLAQDDVISRRIVFLM